jgi:predicted nucleotidyltransferase
MDVSAAESELRESVPDLIAVYLFGSVARRDANRESDVDLAVLAREPIGSPLRFELGQRLEAAAIERCLARVRAVYAGIRPI